MSRPSYKRLYEQEKARRKAYELLYPDVAEKYEIAHAAALRLYQDIERVVLFGGTEEELHVMVGLVGAMTLTEVTP